MAGRSTIWWPTWRTLAGISSPPKASAHLPLPPLDALAKGAGAPSPSPTPTVQRRVVEREQHFFSRVAAMDQKAVAMLHQGATPPVVAAVLSNFSVSAADAHVDDSLPAAAG